MSMSVLQIKNDVLKLIGSTDDISVLQQIKDILNNFEQTIKWDDLPKGEQDAIRIGLKESKEGKGIPNEVVQKEIYEKLKNIKKQYRD